MRMVTRLCVFGAVWLSVSVSQFLPSIAWPAEQPGQTRAEATWQWSASGPLLEPQDLPGFECYSVKDPTIVRFEDRWHLFATVRGKPRSHAILYLSFRNWSEVQQAPRHILPMHDGFCCAPQVFYFEPQRKWYLLCQASSPEWDPEYQPAFATSERLSDPAAWSPLQPLGAKKPAEAQAWLDFWIICDATRAHLFFTSLDGRMWRAETTLAQFPHGWSEATVCLQGDVFEASHTYRLQGREEYLTLIEAQNGFGWRYYKAYRADRLDGPWQPVAADKEHAFASQRNVQQPTPQWTDSISHGELLRSGIDQHLEVDPNRLRFLFQGVLDADRSGKPYGEIPWRLGLLESR